MSILRTDPFTWTETGTRWDLFDCAVEAEPLSPFTNVAHGVNIEAAGVAEHLKFHAPFYYAPDTTVIFTLEGVSVPAQLNITNLAFQIHGAEMLSSTPVAVNGNDVSYLVRFPLTGTNAVYRIDMNSFPGFVATTGDSTISTNADPGNCAVVTSNTFTKSLSFTGFHNEKPLWSDSLKNDYKTYDPKISVPTQHNGTAAGKVIIDFAVIDASRTQSVSEGLGSDFEKIEKALGVYFDPPAWRALPELVYLGAGFTVKFEPSNVSYNDVGWVQFKLGGGCRVSPTRKYADVTAYEVHHPNQKTTADLPGSLYCATGGDFRTFLYKTGAPCPPVAVINWSYNVVHPLGVGDPKTTLIIQSVTSPVPMSDVPQWYKDTFSCP